MMLKGTKDDFVVDLEGPQPVRTLPMPIVVRTRKYDQAFY